MPHPIIFSASVKGHERRLFSVEERQTTRDLTIVVKHSLFSTQEEGGVSTEADRIIEERFSVHCSPNSDRANGIKYTKVAGDSKNSSYQYTEAIKVYKQFAIVFMRRNGNISDDRYLLKREKDVFISLGPYDPTYFHIVYMVLISSPDRQFIIPPLSYINSVQRVFTRFKVVVLWQFMMFSSDLTTKSLVPKTFHKDDIAAERDLWTRVSMARMAVGVSEIYALSLFTKYKFELAHSLIDMYWRKASAAEKEEFEDMKESHKALDIYVLKGTPFSDEHVTLLQSVQRFIKRRQKKRSST
jgi:hypothetical protein